MLCYLCAGLHLANLSLAHKYLHSHTNVPHLMFSCSVSQRVTCEISNPNVLVTGHPLNVTIFLGNLSVVIGSVQINEPITTAPPSEPPASNKLLVILIPIFAGVFIICAAVFIVVVAVFCSKAKQKDRRYDELMVELEKLESSVARECKLGTYIYG